MTPVTPAEGHQIGASAIDPISRQILQRTMTQHKTSSTPPQITPKGTPATAPEDVLEDSIPEVESLRKSDTGLSHKPSQSKKKSGSFLSRIMGGKKRDGGVDLPDNASEIHDDRYGGSEAEVFSQPVGYVPKFPAPPRYIRVKAQNRKKRDLDRLFLAQILQDPQKTRKRSEQVDSKILAIGDKPMTPAPNSSRKSSNPVWASGFSKDGRYYAAAGQDKVLRVWEVVSSKEVREAEDEHEHAESADSTSNMKLNAPVFRQRLIREYDGHTAAILDISWSKNNFLLSSSMDKTVRLHHVSRDDCLCAFRHNDFVTSIQFHPRDDRFFLAGSLDAKLRLWSIPDKSVAYWAQVPDMITAVSFTPDGKTAIAGCLSGLCILYNTEGLTAHSQIHVRSTRGRNTKGSKITGIETISMQQEGGQVDTKLLITSNDSRIRMYNLRDRALEIKFRGHENSTSQIRASFSDDGKFVICGSEDRKVYMWPTGPLERPDSDKRPMEVFEAHSSMVTTAVFAPTNTRRLLSHSGDPIYDVCNPPPVVLQSRADSVLSSPAPTHHSGGSEDKNTDGQPRAHSPSRLAESPTYQARSAHRGGHIIVTADSSGQIKVFREDCAYQKRRDSNWETGSTISRRVLNRTASMATRASATSLTRRSSLNVASKTNSTDRIINWRNSIATTHGQNASVSDFSMRRTQTDRDRSSSPRKSLSQRLSLRYSNNPWTHSSAPPTPDKARHPTSLLPSNTAAATAIDPAVPAEPNAEEQQEESLPIRHTVSAPSNLRPESRTYFRNSTILSPVGENGEFATVEVAGLATGLSAPTVDDNPMMLVDDHSYLAWDTQQLAALVNHAPRTPGSLAVDQSVPGNPLSRATSSVSRLSSDMAGSSVNGDRDQNDTGSRPIGNRQRQFSTATKGENTDEEELKCKNCGGEKFKMVKMSNGGRGLRCKACTTVIV